MNIAIAGLKNWKAPVFDEIPVKLLKYEGEESTTFDDLQCLQ